MNSSNGLQSYVLLQERGGFDRNVIVDLVGKQSVRTYLLGVEQKETFARGHVLYAGIIEAPTVGLADFSSDVLKSGKSLELPVELTIV